jgi:ADP-L-glycero-D-manno-heptose 6-epimerase
MDVPCNINFIAMPTYLVDKYQYYTKADISKLRRLGYDKQMTKLNDAVVDYVKNYLRPGRLVGE